MFYCYEWLAIRNNGRFSLCWLAATNPTAFRNHVKKGQLEAVRVSNICDEILKMLNTRSQNPKERLSLYLASNLTFGIVKIYEKIVNNLLEEVSSSLVVQSFTLKNFMIDDEEEDEESQRPKKRQQKGQTSKRQSKRPKLTNALLMTEDLDTMLDIPNMPQAAHTSANELISLRETPHPAQEQLEPLCPDEFFGEINTQNVGHVMDFIENMAGRIFVAENVETQDTQQSASAPSIDTPLQGMSAQSIDLSGLPGPSKGRIVASTPLPRAQKLHTLSSVFNEDISSIACVNVTPLPEESNTNQQLQQIPEEQEIMESIPEIPQIHHDAVALPESEGPQEASTEPEQIATEAPAALLELAQVATEELYALPGAAQGEMTQLPPDDPPDIEEIPKRRSRKRKMPLQIDQVKIIPASKMKLQEISFNSTMRCLRGRDDIYRAQLDKNFLSQPMRKRMAEPLMEQFVRNCKVRCIDQQADILAGILIESDANNNQPIEEVLGPILEDFHRFGNNRVTRKRQAAPPLQVEFLLPQEEMLEMQQPPVMEIQPEVPGNFAEILQERQEIGDRDFTPESVLATLQTHWDRKTNPITMKIVLQGVTGRMVAARAFMSILQLGKQRKIKLHRNDANLEIAHIAPGTA